MPSPNVAGAKCFLECFTRVEACELYNYRIAFRKTRILLIEVPKAASSTIKTALFMNEFGVGQAEAARLTNADARMQAYPGSIALLPDLSDCTFRRIAMIRNPWDRVASGYWNVGGEPFLRRDGVSFSEFVCSLPERLATSPEDQFNNHFKPCSYFMPPCGSGREIDHLGKIEAINDFREALACLVDLPGFAFGHANRSPAYDARSMYTSSQRQMVGDLYKDDIALGDYSD